MKLLFNSLKQSEDMSKVHRRWRPKRSLSNLRRRARHRLMRPRPIVFDHLPKCGGTSLSHGLMSCYPDDKVFQVNGSGPAAMTSSIEYFTALDAGDAWRFELVLGHMACKLVSNVRPDALMVTVLRHPVARVLSLYKYVCRRREHYLHRQVWERHIGLSEFVALRFEVEHQDTMPELANEPRNWYATHFTGWPLQEVERRPREAADLAIATMQNHYDVVGTMEDFGALLRALNQRAGLGLRKLRHRNVGRASPSPAAEPERASEIIADANAVDIEIYHRALKEVACG